VSACAIVLAGGKGTRSADPTVPKVSQEIGGKSLLQWQIDLIREAGIPEAIVVAGHLSEAVFALCELLDTTGVKLQVVSEPHPQGTVKAVEFAAEFTSSTNFLVLSGDVLAKFPSKEFLQQFEASGANAAVVIHPSTHPQDSDKVFPRHDTTVQVLAKGQSSEGIPNLASAGVFALTREALANYGTAKDIGSDLLFLAAENHDLFAFNSSHYLKDTGTPDRLASAQKDYESGTFARRSAPVLRHAILLDRDGVINAVNPEVYRSSDYQVLPGVAAALTRINQSGIPVFVVTNQPGIAKGYMSFHEHERIRASLDQQLGSCSAFVDDYYFCPHHPEGGHEGEVLRLKTNCSCRKPNTGMAISIANDHGVDLRGSIVIGDTWRDEGLATRIGSEFLHVSANCQLSSQHKCFPSTPAALANALDQLTC